MTPSTSPWPPRWRCGPHAIVTNDFDLGPDERVLVITGPNNGGKTTFARAFGQLHYLASLGLPVPAREADLVLADAVLASFAQAERLGTGRSHLEEELAHLHGVIGQASRRSVIVLNESFSSTTLRDAALLGRAVLAQLVARGSLCAFVTFVDELATANEATISMVAAVHPDDPALRTYKILPRAPGGLAYAAALAERYGLTYRAVSEQVAKENRPTKGEDKGDGVKVLLMHPSEDFKLDCELPPESDDLVQDLGLSTLFEAMARGDKFLHAAGMAAVLSPLVEPSEIVYRQEALTDCLAHPEFAKQLYSLATEAVDSHKKIMSWGLTPSPESLHYISLQAMELLLGYLVQLRRVTDEQGSELASPAFVRLRSLVLSEFDDAYLKLLKAHLDELRLESSLWMSAQLGRANKGTGYVLQRAPARGRRERLSRRGQTGYSFKVRDDDDKRLRALDELKARGIIAGGQYHRPSCREHRYLFQLSPHRAGFLYRVPKSAVCLGAKGGADLYSSTNAGRQPLVPGDWPLRPWPQSPYGRAHRGQRLERRQQGARPGDGGQPWGQDHVLAQRRHGPTHDAMRHVRGRDVV